MENYRECMADCKRLLETEPQNREAKLLMRQAAQRQKEADQKSKAVFASGFDREFHREID